MNHQNQQQSVKSSPAALRKEGRGSGTTAITPRKNQKRPRSRNHTLANSMPAVHIRTHDMLTPQERRFLDAAEKGNRPTLIACLKQKTVPLNVNAVDGMGRTAIEIAVDNENMEIVELLLQQDGIKIGNALLCAIREGVYELVEVLVNHPSITKEMLGEGWSKSLDPTQATTSEYSSDISPVILAAQLNQFEILQMLLRKDAKIEKPHKSHCTCETCETERITDGLASSLKRLNTYRALASPAWISLTSPDPILTAFRLSRELQQRAKVEDEFKDMYLQLSEQCKQYACDLLSQCRSTEEVMAVLNKEEGQSINEEIDLSAAKCSLARLKRAIKYEQKTFVAHPHCQQLLTSIWYEGVPLKKQRGSSLATIGISALLVLAWPILAIAYIIFPKSRVGAIVRSPFMKFLYYSLSFGCFLILLTLVTFESYRSETGAVKGGGQHRAADRGPPPTKVEWLVFIWVLGMFWSEVKQLWQEGLTKYVTQWWNWLDFIMICLYLCTISIRASAYYIYTYSNTGYTPKYAVRTHWNAYEPMLVAEALFAVGNVFSFARIIYLFQTNPYLGPLQISLGCMLVDVAKFCFIFVLIISSFSIGLAQLYWYYDPATPVCLTPDNCKEPISNAFSSIATSYMTLLWSLFSITKVEDTDVIENHYFTQWIGRSMFIMYHMTSIIVLLNMLIAMMSHSFERINDHADLEWKFHRTKLWMAHFDEGSTLPPPFNIIPTPKAAYKAFKSLMNTVKWTIGQYHYSSKNERYRATIRRPGYNRRSREPEVKIMYDRKPTYMEIIQRLVSRFILEQKRSNRMDGVSEDDLKEIKQDISSLRYELRDDRQREIARSSSHIDAVKRDIMRTMSATRFGPARPLVSRRTLSTRERERHERLGEPNGENEDDNSEEDSQQEDYGSCSEYNLGGGNQLMESMYSNTLSPTVSSKGGYDIPSINLNLEEDDDQQQLYTTSPVRYRSRTGTMKATEGEGGARPPIPPPRKESHGTLLRKALSTREPSEAARRAMRKKRSGPVRSATLDEDDGDEHQHQPVDNLEALQRIKEELNEQLDRFAASLLISPTSPTKSPPQLETPTSEGPGETSHLRQPPSPRSHGMLIRSDAGSGPSTPTPTPASAEDQMMERLRRNLSPSRVSFNLK